MCVFLNIVHYKIVFDGNLLVGRIVIDLNSMREFNYYRKTSIEFIYEEL